MKKFGKTLLKTFAIALVFGIVAACTFGGVTYFLGEQFDITPFVIHETVAAEEAAREETAEPAGTGEQTSAETVQGEENPSAAVSETTVAAAGAAEKSDADLVEEVMPAIVAITTLSTVEYSTIWGERGTYDSKSAGSGIIVEQNEENLYIVTNAHVAEGADTLVVQFVDGTDAEGTVRGSDTSRDLAVVEVPLSEIDPETLQTIRVASIGDSTALRVGDPAIAIGNALGYGQSITKGVISALDREVTATDSQTGISIMNHCIQTDAAINPGNSGGALLNERGEVVGINEIKYMSTDVEGIGYAIPMATAMPVIEQIIAHETVPEERAAFLGIQGIEVTTEDADRYQMPLGIYLAQVVEGSAADQAGLQTGDILISIDGNDISTQENLMRAMSYYAAGDTAVITYMRADNGKYIEHTAEVTFGSKND